LVFQFKTKTLWFFSLRLRSFGFSAQIKFKCLRSRIFSVSLLSSHVVPQPSFSSSVFGSRKFRCGGSMCGIHPLEVTTFHSIHVVALLTEGPPIETIFSLEVVDLKKIQFLLVVACSQFSWLLCG